MKATAVSGLQDPIKPGTGGQAPNWDSAWLSTSIDGVLLVAGNTTGLVREKLDRIIKLFDGSVQLAFEIHGQVRPGEFRGTEHFGFKDGISQPSNADLPNFTKEELFVPPGQDVIPQGVILCGRPGDLNASRRPAWMMDGSFLCFRKLQQNVQDWDRFLVTSSNELGTFAHQLGSRLVGRGKSGCPINLQPYFDDTTIGNDVMRNNLFEFDPPGLHKAGDQSPEGRSSVHPHRILRRGIPYGPEISEDPDAERGLLFACYQSDLGNGFELIQRFWANNETFRFQGAGVDTVMGQTNSKPTVGMKGLFPQDASRELQLPGVNRFVVPRGGEYFFSPSLSALMQDLSTGKAVGDRHGGNIDGHDELRK